MSGQSLSRNVMHSVKEVVQCNTFRLLWVPILLYFLAKKYKVKLLKSYGVLKRSRSQRSVFCFPK